MGAIPLVETFECNSMVAIPLGAIPWIQIFGWNPTWAQFRGVQFHIYVFPFSGGKVRFATVQTYGDTTHTLIEK